MDEDKIWRLIFYPLGLLTLCLSIYVLFANGIGHAIVLVVVGALLLLAPRLKDLIKLEIGVASIKAEMQQAVADARATVTQLHLLAAALGKETIRSAQAEGRWGGRSRKEREKVSADTAAAMRALGMSEPAVAEVVATERAFIHFDYAHWAASSANPSRENQKKWNEFFAGHEGIGSEPSPNELRQFLASISAMSPETEERLKDYEHYDRAWAHRHPNVWYGDEDE